MVAIACGINVTRRPFEHNNLMNIDPSAATARAERCHRRTSVSQYAVVLAALGFLLQGCDSFGSMWPSLSADDPAGTDQPAAAATPSPDAAAAGAAPGLPPAITPLPASVMAAAPAPRPVPVTAVGTRAPALGTGNFEPQPLTPGSPTGTFVGQRVQQLRADLARLQGNVSQHNAVLQQARAQVNQDSQRYRTIVAGVQTRLQVASAANDPELVATWRQAQAALGHLQADVAKLTELADRAAPDAGLSTFLLQSVRDGYGLSGAVPEDHRQLAVLEGDTNRTVALIGRLLFELRDDIARQTGYLGAEQRNLVHLSAAIENGGFYGARRAGPAFVAAPPVGARPAVNATGQVMFRPLVVIRFDRPNVDYRQAVYDAASQALQRRADAVFDVVAVTPATGTPAAVARHAGLVKGNAESVLRALIDMGLPASQVTLSATSSNAIRGNEVHIYVR